MGAYTFLILFLKIFTIQSFKIQDQQDERGDLS